MVDDLTDDHLLGGRLRFSQPAHGYRVAIDPVLLAAAVTPLPYHRVLDAGAGTGAASLCLAARVPECRILGLEIQRNLHRIASHNVTRNEFDRRVEMIQGDLQRPPPRFSGASFDHVMSNPPHLAADQARSSPDRERALAHAETSMDLAGWLAACLRMLKPDGCLTLIHRADRLDQLLAALLNRAGDVIVFPLWPVAAGRPAKRVLIQARKGARGPLRLAPGLVLHNRDGSFSEAAEGVLRAGRALDLTAGCDDGAT
ncbi:MAG: tRNA1(Val) (adenine(37)-N6)-methyltransferase [Geminicoccaceae bacterium]